MNLYVVEKNWGFDLFKKMGEKGGKGQCGKTRSVFLKCMKKGREVHNDFCKAAAVNVRYEQGKREMRHSTDECYDTVQLSLLLC